MSTLPLSPGAPPETGAVPTWNFGRNAEVGFTPRQRLDAFQAAVSPAWDVSADAASFDMSESVYLMGGGVVYSSHYPGMEMSRTVQSVRRAEVDYYALQLKQRGEIRLNAEGRHVRVAPGQILLSDFTRASHVTLNEGHQLMALIPRNEFDRVLSKNLDLHGLNLHQMASGAGAGLLASHLKALDLHLPRMGLAEAASALEATMFMLAATLAPSIASLGMARQAIDQSLIHQARELVDRHLKSAALGPDILCRELGVSRSTLYRLFEPFGGVASHIRERRLAQIHSQLTGQAGQRTHRYLGRLADDYGFSSQSSFNRAFREQFGYSPREAQEMKFSADSLTTSHRMQENKRNLAQPQGRLWPHAALER